MESLTLTVELGLSNWSEKLKGQYDMQEQRYHNVVNEKNPPVTVFIATYNRSKYLKECVESVIGQSFQNIAIVILDNHSTDDTRQVAEIFEDDRLCYIRHDTNLGGGGNLNSAIEMCVTPYYIIFHDDDIMCHRMIEKEYKVISSGKYAIVGTGSAVLYDKCTHTAFESDSSEIIEYKEGAYVRGFLAGEIESITCPSVMFSAEFMKRNSLRFNTNAGPAGDNYLWFEVERHHGIIAVMEETLMMSRRHADQDSSNNYPQMDILLMKYMTQSNHYLSDLHYIEGKLGKRYILYIKLLVIQKGQKCLDRDEMLNYLDMIPVIQIKNAWTSMFVGIFNTCAKYFPNVLYLLYIIKEKLRIRISYE